MIKKLAWALGLGILFAASPVWAAESHIEVKQEIRQNNNEVRYSNSTVNSEVSGNATVSVKVNGVEMATGSGRPSEEVKRMIEEKRAAMREKFETFKGNLEKRRQEAEEKFKAKREEFQKKWEQLKDERKKQILERVDTKLGEINTKRTEAMTAHLDKMVSLLERVTARTNEAKAAGKNTATVDTAITNAQAAITTAQTAVGNQAAKQYVINITAQTKLKSDAQTAINNLHQDLKLTHDQIVAARRAVSQVLRALAQVLGEPTPPAVTD